MTIGQKMSHIFIIRTGEFQVERILNYDMKIPGCNETTDIKKRVKLFKFGVGDVVGLEEFRKYLVEMDRQKDIDPDSDFPEIDHIAHYDIICSSLKTIVYVLRFEDLAQLLRIERTFINRINFAGIKKSFNKIFDMRSSQILNFVKTQNQQKYDGRLVDQCDTNLISK